MAHRTLFSNDINLPPKYQQQRIILAKQIQQIKQKQKTAIQEGNQKILILEKRLVYGKKKIFGYDKKWNRMPLEEELSHCNKQILNLKRLIAAEQQGLNIQKNAQNVEKSKNLKVSPNNVIIKPSQEQKRQISNPQQQILKLTHEIMRLKKSLQEVRSKYSDNFTQYKLKEEYQKMKQQNKQLAQQLKQLQKQKNIIKQSSVMNDTIDYDEMENLNALKEYQMIQKQRSLLRQYLKGLEEYQQQQQQSQQRKVKEYKQQKIVKLKQEIVYFKNQNAILIQEVTLTESQIQRRKQFQKSRALYL